MHAIRYYRRVVVERLYSCLTICAISPYLLVKIQNNQQRLVLRVYFIEMVPNMVQVTLFYVGVHYIPCFIACVHSGV